MTDSSVATWLILIGFIEGLAVLLAMSMAISSHVQRLDSWYKFGSLLLVYGMCVQLFRSTHYLAFGIYPVDHFIPLWIAKDIGASIVVFRYAFLNRLK